MEKPPGLWFFNEARRRAGLIPKRFDLVNIQIPLLHALFYGTCARHLEYWQSIQEASHLCQNLIHCSAITWSSHEGDILKRVYWACICNEIFFHRELDMPYTSAGSMSDWIQLPIFPEESGETAQATAEAMMRRSRGQHFLALVSLSRLTARVNELLHTGKWRKIYSPFELRTNLERNREQWRYPPRIPRWADQSCPT